MNDFGLQNVRKLLKNIQITLLLPKAFIWPIAQNPKFTTEERKGTNCHN